jgi:alpha-maltose-1-phosphate synthase
MNFWLPYTRGGSGSDVCVEFLAQGLRDAGHEAISQPFHHHFQYAPWLLRQNRPPTGTEVIISNSWNGFVFHRKGCANITVEHLFVLDPAYAPYRSAAQALFHNTLVRYFLRRSIATSDAGVAVSDYTAGAVANNLLVSRPLTILNAVDTNFFTPPASDERLQGASRRPFRLLFVGNFARRKGSDILIDVMRRLGDDFELAFTSGRNTLRDDALPKNMRCLGQLSFEDVRDAYRQADALLFPSRLEGLPLTVLESLACGTPVIAADTSSLPEAVDHMRTGILCPIDDVDAFIAAAQQLKENPSLRARMTTAAREDAEQRFSLVRMVQQYVDLAERLTSSRSRVGNREGYDVRDDGGGSQDQYSI